MQIRPALAADHAAVLALNLESERFLSPLSAERLDMLAAEAEVHWVVEDAGLILGFMLAFCEGAGYDSVNYRWFAERYPRFLLRRPCRRGRTAQGKGLGALLYRAVFAHAKATSVPVVVCEFDIDPPNPASAAFHARFGFSEVGQQRVAGGKKAVSLQLAHVT